MILETPSFDRPFVLAAALFGSRARGDSDSSSDTDVVVFADVENVAQLRNVKEDLSSHSLGLRQTLSLYSGDTAEYMAQEGSLFLWHLRLEGVVLIDNQAWLSNLLKNLSPYDNARALRDLDTFEQVLFDCEYSASMQSDTIAFEMATTSAVLRNLGIIHCFTRGIPCFGRTAPIMRLANYMGERFPFSPEQVRALEHARLAYIRDPEQEVPHMNASTVKVFIDGTSNVLQFVRNAIL